MSNPLEELLAGYGDGVKGQIVTMTIGEIVEMDREYNRAAKVVLRKEESIGIEDDEYIYNVPIATLVTADYALLMPFKRGDRVCVVFSHRDLDNILANDGSDAKDQSFSKSNAVIIGGINVFTERITGDWTDDDIVLTKRDNTASVVLKANNDVQVNTDARVFLGGVEGSQGVPLGDELKAWLDSHTHEYNWTADGGNGVSSPATSASPIPSKKVFTQ